jgi:hypothetical protein
MLKVGLSRSPKSALDDTDWIIIPVEAIGASETPTEEGYILRPCARRKYIVDAEGTGFETIGYSNVRSTIGVI